MVTLPTSLQGVQQQLAKATTEAIGRVRAEKTPPRWLGLDVGSTSIKLAELELTPAGPRLLKSLVQELPASTDGEAVDRIGWLQSALKEFGVGEVHVALSGPEVAIRRVHMPPMSLRELSEAVKWQVKDEVPFPIQDAELAFQVVGEVWEKDLKKQDVLVAAASKSSVRELMSAVERAGTRVISMTPTPLAVWSCLAGLVPETKQGAVLVMEFGAVTTHMAIVKDGHLRVTRDLALGSATLTETLVGETSTSRGHVAIDHSKAEAFKRRYGVVTESTQGETEEGIPLFYLASVMRPVLENLVTEVSRFLDFYKVQVDEAGVSRVLVCGGGANLKSLQPYLAEGLGVAVEMFNPLARITQRAQVLEAERVAEEGPRLAVAIGCALDHGQGLNLLPAEVRRARASGTLRKASSLGGKVLGGIALTLYLGLWLTAWILGWQVGRQQTAWAQLEPIYTQYMSVASARKGVEGKIAQVRMVLEQQPVWEGIFKELGALMPQSVELDELHVESGVGMSDPGALRVVMKGHVASGGSAGQGSLSQFVEALEQSIFFRDVELVSSELRSRAGGATAFEVEGVLE